ncbi:copper resistance protein CopB [Bordetella genomosp. 13]|uniref:Copper resistance protein CopB n=2 Tax=Bordetella genomosp. 13 TaxID=463040 RepID=A0A1W6ZJC7_9BORD|nr:copper resistance protein CopB [Bordetella genomosp. 13]
MATFYRPAGIARAAAVVLGFALPFAASAQSNAPTQSRTPIPVLTDADRKAANFDAAGHAVHDTSINYQFLFDELEWQEAKDGSALNWDFTGWVGGDIDRLWLRSEGERTNGKLEHVEVQALWGHSITPWWDLVGGIRQDFKPGPSQTWAAFGLQGLALYNFESEITVFVGDSGQTALRLKGEYDILITNRLILQPMAEVNFYGKNDPDRDVGAGLANSEVGLRLRYEIRREFAPYIGVTWNRSYGNTADFVRAAGENRNETRFLVGVRMWL